MQRVHLRFYEELNDFLPDAHQKRDFESIFELPRSVKDLIESHGVPHVEVDLVLVNGVSVDFEHLVGDGDRISVYPMFESLDLEGVTRLRPKPLRTPSFVLDVHLHTLARKLRMLGFDTIYSNTADDDLAEISSRENRILLTRDIGLLKRSQLRRGLFVRSTDPVRQIEEILDRLDLYALISPFSRCIRCNGAITVIQIDACINAGDRREIERNVPQDVRDRNTSLHRCEGCEKFYWKGSHFERMLVEVERLKQRKTGDC